MWKNERQQEEQINLMLQSLTLDKRIQASLKVFLDKLPRFLEYIQDQGVAYMRKLGLPVFEGSLLLGSPKDKAIDSKSNTSHVKGTLVRNSVALYDGRSNRPST